MARQRITSRISIDFTDDSPEWNRIRTSPEMVAQLEARGEQWTERLNADLHSAQAARNQPVEDGYSSDVTTGGSRARLYVWPYTARAIAHEAVNQSMLKLVPVGSINANKGPDHRVPAELAAGEYHSAAESRAAKAAAARERRRAARKAKKAAQ